MASMEAIIEICVKLSAAYPNWNVSEYTYEVYYQDLLDLTDEEARVAAQHCRAENGRKFAPSTGEIRGAVAELRGMASNLPSSFQAWQEVLGQVRAVGSYGKPVFSHSIVARAVDALGWRDLCLSENATADRARFIQAYEQLTERAAREDMLLPEVRGYLVSNGASLPAPMESVHLLADRLSVKNGRTNER